MVNDSPWTTDALKEYVDSNFESVRNALEARYIEKNREHDKFEATVQATLYKQNEFRGALSDLGLSMATRREVETIEEKYDSRLGRIEGIQAKVVGGLILISSVMMPAVVVITYLLSR